MTGSDYSAIGSGFIRLINVLIVIAITTTVAITWLLYLKFVDRAVKPIDTSLTFTATNRLVVTHYIIIPATDSSWHTLTSRYPANVTRTTLKFE